MFDFQQVQKDELYFRLMKIRDERNEQIRHDKLNNSHVDKVKLERDESEEKLTLSEISSKIKNENLIIKAVEIFEKYGKVSLELLEGQLKIGERVGTYLLQALKTLGYISSGDVNKKNFMLTFEQFNELYDKNGIKDVQKMRMSIEKECGFVEVLKVLTLNRISQISISFLRRNFSLTFVEAERYFVAMENLGYIKPNVTLLVHLKDINFTEEKNE